MPREIEIFRGRDVEKIRCGTENCYIKCDGKHYVWGDNWANQCAISDDVYRRSVIPKPQIIDLKDFKIKDVFLGNNNTKFLVYE